MIEIKNLTKIYKSKNKKKCVALDNLSFVLPDTGLVFIIGKSGSGKSTLLNMIGGLDNVTSGEIVADGNVLSSFSHGEFNKFRSSYLGFVFQYYNLIDNLNIKRNIELSLDIAGIKDKSIIKEVLEKVEMQGKEKRYPPELSGGQRQRIAIARAIAKDPKIILGDEPTGNLDNKTSVMIMKLLKDISKEKLVVIVSHDLTLADEYADRIIELSDGKIIKDVTKIKGYKNKFTMDDGNVCLPYHKDLTKREVKKLETAFANKEVKNVSQLNNGFGDTTNVKATNRKIELVSHKISKRNVFKLSSMFIKKNKATRFSTIILTTLLFMVVTILQSFLNFNSNITSKPALERDLILYKSDQVPFENTIYSAAIHQLKDEEINNITEVYGEDNYHILYSYGLCSSQSNQKIPSQMTQDYYRLVEDFYAVGSLGTLNCDEQFLIDRYGVDGKLNYLAGNPETIPYGCIITDYMADSILNFLPSLYKTYDSLIGENKVTSSGISYGYISAIIDTNYETKYASILERYQNEMNEDEKEDLYNELSETSLYKEFLTEVTSYLAVGYNFSENFLEEFENCNVIGRTVIRGASFFDDKGNSYRSELSEMNVFTYSSSSSSYYNLADNEAIMPYGVYNKMFGTNYNESTHTNFEPHDIKVVSYYNSDPNDEIFYEKTLKLTKLSNSNVTTTAIITNKATVVDLLDGSIVPFGIYFEDPVNDEEIIAKASEFGLYVKNIDFDNVLIINKLNQAFKPFFNLILIILLVFQFSYLFNFGIYSIKNNLYEIGVIKSLGGKSRNLSAMFVINVFITGFFICVLSIIFSPLFLKIADMGLRKSFEVVLNTHMYDLIIIKNIPSLITFNLFLIVIVTLVSSLFSMITLYKVKPIEIIRAKE